ncbi:MAG TPA: hypothetical protein VNV38_07440 [Stellaceae bacterium]|jgi:hypothetical protein|nr:hypothetical protein [Stellaceae bacterium]
MFDCAYQNHNLVLFLCVAIAACGATTAALPDNLTITAVLAGKCTSATAMDVAMKSGPCTDKIIQVELPNQRLGFTFFLRREGEKNSGTFFAFWGDGSKQLHLNPDTAMQPIDRVDFFFQGSTDHLVAAGSCRFSNPYKGVPAQVSCSADTNEGKFTGEFISDGRPPDMTQTR